MNRVEFMKMLENLLNDISEEEKQEALAYYNGYFEDAGEENEESIIRELESPQKVAETIKAGLREEAGSSDDNHQYTEKGYQRQNGFAQQDFQKPVDSNLVREESEKKKNVARIILLIIVAVLTSPAWGGLLGGVLGLICGAFGILIGVIAALGGITIGLLCGGGACFGVAIAQILGGAVATGILLFGVAFLLWAIALLSFVLLILVCGRFLPWLVRTSVALCRRPFQKKKEGQFV